MRSQPTYRPLVFAAVAGWVALSLVFLTRTYATNDDYAIEADIRGGFPTSFQSPVAGAVLSAFHRVVAYDFPWYPLYLYAVLALALSVLVTLVLDVEAKRPIRVLLGLSLLVTTTGFAVAIGYNGVSILAGAAGLLGIARHLGEASVPRRRVVLGLGLLLACCYLTRAMGVVAAAAFAGPPAVLLGGRALLRHWRSVALFAAPLTVAVGATLLHGLSAGEDVDRFREWNAVRGRFHGYSVVSEVFDEPSLYEANGWSLNDYRMLRGSMFLDEEKFNTESVSRLLEAAAGLGAGPTWSDVEAKLAKFVWEPHRAAVSFLVVLALAAWIARGPRRGGTVALVAASTVLVSCAMTAYLRFPERIAGPGMTAAAVGALCLALRRGADEVRSAPRMRAAHSLVVVCAILVAFVDARDELVHARRRRARQETHYALFERLELLDADYVLVHPRCLSLGLDPLRGSPMWRVRRIPLGWPVYSPRFYAGLAELGLRRARDVFPNLPGRNAFLVFPPSMTALVLTYLRENHGMDCVAVPVYPPRTPFADQIVRLKRARR